mmetsp:Transcript_6562/g.10549  ORF Transcript_6562/g.10549 Transcript_6562/m.10549 type:complete len:81 (-) Transcript_6562:571-813(-)
MPRTADELIKPAVEGTMAIMEAARINKVKRVVITSSCAAVYQTKERLDHYDHTSWSEPDQGTFYEQSKTRAERAAWNYVD